MFNQNIKVYSIVEGEIKEVRLIEGVSYQSSTELSVSGTKISSSDTTMIIIPMNKYKFKINKGDKISITDEEYTSIKELNKNSITVMQIAEHNFGKISNVELSCR